MLPLYLVNCITRVFVFDLYLYCFRHSFFSEKNKPNFILSEPGPLAGANAKDDLLSKMSFWILQG